MFIQNIKIFSFLALVVSLRTVSKPLVSQNKSLQRLSEPPKVNGFHFWLDWQYSATHIVANCLYPNTLLSVKKIFFVIIIKHISPAVY